MKKECAKFLGGVATGVALAVGIRKFKESRTGKVFQKNMKELTADFYKSLMPKIKEMKDASAEDYKDFIADAAEKYARVKRIPMDMAKRFMSEVQDSCEYFYEYFRE